jgi:hypothetical protein
MKPKQPGLLGATITKIMAQKTLRQAEILKRIEKAGQKITSTMLRQIIEGSTIPRNPEYIEAIATALGEDKYTFRSLAVIDRLNKDLYLYKVKLQSVCKGIDAEKKYSVPLFQSTELQKVLSERGYPIVSAHDFIETPYDFGPHAYGIIMKDSILYPKAAKEEICVIAAGKRIKDIARKSHKISERSNY